MRKKSTLGLIGLLIISGSCERTRGNQSIDAGTDNRPVAQVEHADIKKIREELPRIQLPLTFNSDIGITLRSVGETDNGLLNTLEERGFSTFGKIFETEDFVTIIGYAPNDAGSPILLTFDRAGNEIGSHVIYETVMSDMGRYTSNAVTISPDRTIVLTDSTITRQINAEGDDEIPGTDSLIVTRRNYRIADTGAIERIE